MTDRLGELRSLAGLVSRETFDKIEQFEREFRRWSTRINLAAPSTLPDLWRRHILDSAQLATIKPEALRWLDIGSGGGFPGAIMAIILADRPGATIDLVESNQKKAAFLRTILGSMGAAARVHVMRIEDAPETVPLPEIVTARALAPLKPLLGLSAPWLGKGAIGLFHKGRDYAAEVVESRNAWRYDLVEHESKIDVESRILEIAGLEPVSIST